MYSMMTAGPTAPHPDVLRARSKEYVNPDEEVSFTEYYHDICKNVAGLLHTSNDVYILGGEGILSLEAACASLIEPDDRVLVIDNGIFGAGFADFVKIYGGNPVLYTTEYDRAIDVDKLKSSLDNDHDFKLATVVHCDTPTGVLNDIGKICPLLKSYGILTVVDAVSSMFGEDVRVDDWQIDIVCGGSQKALSAPPGLAFVSVSEDAKKAMHERSTPIASFYCNILTFENYYRDKWFPYTMPISDINGFNEAVRIVSEDKDRISRHTLIAQAVRDTLEKAGIKLYLKDGFSSTVTAFVMPDDVDAHTLQNDMKEKYGVLISNDLLQYKGVLLRLGHMGENANVDKVADMLDALDKSLLDQGFDTKISMRDVFMDSLV